MATTTANYNKLNLAICGLIYDRELRLILLASYNNTQANGKQHSDSPQFTLVAQGIKITQVKILKQNPELIISQH